LPKKISSERADSSERTLFPHKKLIKMPGYWRRPIARVYSYNLDLGENYYSPMKDFVASPDYGDREKTPGALTYSERIARKFMESDTDRMMRAKSEVRSRESKARMEAQERASMREAIRATSSGPPPSSRPPTGLSSYRDERKEIGTGGTGYQSVHGEGVERAESVLSQHRRLVREISEDTTQNVSEVGSSRFANDSVYKKMADIRISPWRGEEVESEYRAAQKARARISSMERELNDITRNLMTYRSGYRQSAQEMGQRAREEEQSSSTRTKRTVVEESHRRY